LPLKITCDPPGKRPEGSKWWHNNSNKNKKEKRKGKMVEGKEKRE